MFIHLITKVYADTGGPFDNLKGAMSGQSNQPSSGFNSLTGIMNATVNIVVGLGFAVAIVTAAYAFIQFIISQGEKNAVNQAKQALTWSVIAAVISIIAVAAKTVVFKLVGFTEPTMQI
jgi:hypothetical protein